jgi:glycosyltransferase involved in cell wall biosynthesis
VRRCLLLFSAPDGGVPQVVMRLAHGLSDRGWEPWVAGPESASIYGEVESLGIPIARLPFHPGYRHPLDDGRVLRELIGLLRRHRFDLVHMRSDKAGALGRLAARATGVAAVYDPGGWSFHPAYRGRVGRAFSLRLERLLASHTDAYICVSEAERRLALEHGIADAAAIHVVHNAAPHYDGGLASDPELERFSREGPLAGCITVLRPEKGVDIFLRAAPYVFDRLPEARLAVVGSGALGQALRRLARALGLDDRVRFFDYRPPSARQLQSLDVFVLPPPTHEPFGIALVEAMACGVPQVATPVGGIPEVMRDGETGLFCRPNDPADLAAQIARLLTDSDLRTRMSDASRDRHHEFFTADRMVAERAAVFDLVASGNGR